MAGTPPLDDDSGWGFNVSGFDPGRFDRAPTSDSVRSGSDGGGRDGSITPSQIFDGVTKFLGETVGLIKVIVTRDKPEQPAPPKAKLPTVDDIPITVPIRPTAAQPTPEPSLNDRVLAALANHDD